MSIALQVVVVKRRTLEPIKAGHARMLVTRPPTLNEIAAYAAKMKQQARRMRGVQSGNPHAFHEDKSEMASAWEKLEDAIRKGTLLPLDET